MIDARDTLRHGDAERARRRRSAGRDRRDTARRRTCWATARPPACSSAPATCTANPFTDAYPGYDPAHVGYVFRLELAPGQTEALVTFVVKGLSEVYDPRGGYPITRKDALLSTWSDAVYTGADARCRRPAARSRGSPPRRAGWSAAPDLRGLTPRQRAAIVNWTTPAGGAAAGRSRCSRSRSRQLQAAMGNGTTTSEDIVREYLTRATLYDRHGPTFRAHPRAQPARDRRRPRPRSPRAGAAGRGRVRAVPRRADRAEGQHRHHRAAHDRRRAGARRPPPARRLARRRRHEGRRRRHPRQGQPRRVPVRRLRHQHASAAPWATPTIRRSARPGSSGGSATAVATSLAALAFGTDTCNSLSNPSGFASLATIRTTRGYTSRAGVMPLNTFNDAVGPMGKSVLDVALALDLVTGARPRRPGDARRAANGGRASFAGGTRAGDAERRAHRRVPPALRRHHRRTRSGRDDGPRRARASGRGRHRGRRRDSRTTTRSTRRRAAPRRARSRQDGRPICRAAPTPGDRVRDDSGADRVGQDGAGRPAPARRRTGAAARGGHDRGVHRRTPGLPRAAGVGDGRAEGRRAHLPRQPGAPAHPRRRRRTLRHRARHVRGERRRPDCRRSRCRPATWAAATLSASRSWAGCGTTAGCWAIGLRLRTGDATSASAHHSQVRHGGRGIAAPADRGWGLADWRLPESRSNDALEQCRCSHRSETDAMPGPWSPSQRHGVSP